MPPVRSGLGRAGGSWQGPGFDQGRPVHLHSGAEMALAGNTWDVESSFLQVAFSLGPPSQPTPTPCPGLWATLLATQTQLRVSLSWALTKQGPCGSRWPQRRPWHTFQTLRGGEGHGRPWQGGNPRALGSPGPRRPSVGPADSAWPHSPWSRKPERTRGELGDEADAGNGGFCSGSVCVCSPTPPGPRCSEVSTAWGRV